MITNQRVPLQLYTNRKFTGINNRFTSQIRLAGLCVIFAVAMAFTGCDSSVDSVSQQSEIQTQTLTEASNAQVRVDVCHVNGKGEYNKITIADAAYETHIAHGDGGIGDAVPGMEGYIFDEECQPEKFGGW